MNCRQIQERLTAYLDGELRPRDRQRVAAHLDTCAQCRAEQRAIVALRRLLADHPPMQTPVDFTYLARQIPVRSAVPLWLRGIPRALAGAAAVAGVLIGVRQWQQPGRDEPIARRPPAIIVSRDGTEVEELHRSFAVQQALDSRDGVLLFAHDWAGPDR